MLKETLESIKFGIDSFEMISTNRAIVNLLEGNKIYIQLDLSRGFDLYSTDWKEKMETFESIEGLLSQKSLLYREKFQSMLISKLNSLESSSNDDPDSMDSVELNPRD